ncbi:MAG: GGDEF domain-containing protein [Spirochaetales bacterium]|nr:GGDEF domain-containing protein [Spirochaetales bacterium]
MLDIDHFKQVNDSFGHGVGDTVLKGISDIIMKRIRTTDIVGRYGGEEFIVLLPESGKTEAVKVAEDLRISVSTQLFPRLKTVTISCGVVEMQPDCGSIEALINTADSPLYKAKQNKLPQSL